MMNFPARHGLRKIGTLGSTFPWLLAVLMASLIFPGCKSVPNQSPLPVDAKVLAFGDSLTFGTGVRPEESYPVVLQSLINREVINGGVPGETTAEGLKRLPIWLDEYEPKLLVLCHGANDLLRSLGEEKAADNVRAMVKMARDRGIEVVLIAVPKFGLMRAPPAFYEEIAIEFDIPIEKNILDDIVRTRGLRSDSVHPNVEGYRLIAQAVLKRLQKSGAL
jgi:lysophospholipase L1-like esterase